MCTTGAQAQLIPAVNTPQNLPVSVADLVETVSPAVVNIVVRADTGETTSEGQGSGFIISESGEVVTNYHVIEGGSSITVVFNNGVEFPAEIVGTDEETDLALLKISTGQRLPAVKWYNGNPIRIGDWVIAIGNPFGIGQSTSLGIISAIGRDRVESGAYVDYIQTDATINRGNSGGPLFNPYGDVVGVNSAIFSPTGASVGIAFSIPHKTAKDVIDEIRQYGKVRRGWLGVGLRTAEFSSDRAGAHVNNVVAGGPAHMAGLQIDDIILSINGQSVANSIEATRVIGKVSPGSRVAFRIDRNESEMDINAVVAERPEKDIVEQSISGGSVVVSPAQPSSPSPSPLPYSPPGASGSLASIGLSLVDLSASFRRNIGMRYDQVGIYVESVIPGSQAAEGGLKSNTVILEANQEPVASVREFQALISKAKQSRHSDILLLVREADGQENYRSLRI